MQIMSTTEAGRYFFFFEKLTVFLIIFIKLTIQGVSIIRLH